MSTSDSREGSSSASAPRTRLGRAKTAAEIVGTDWEKRRVRDEMVAAAKLHLNIVEDLPLFIQTRGNAKQILQSAPESLPEVAARLKKQHAEQEKENHEKFLQSEEGRDLAAQEAREQRAARAQAEKERRIAKDIAAAEQARKRLSATQGQEIQGNAVMTSAAAANIALGLGDIVARADESDSDAASMTTSTQSTASRLSHDLTFGSSEDEDEYGNERVRSDAELNLMKFSAGRMLGMSMNRKTGLVPGRRSRKPLPARLGSPVPVRKNNYALVSQRMAKDGASLMGLKSFHAKSILVRNAHNVVTKNRFSFRTSNGFNEDPRQRVSRSETTGDILRQGLLLPGNSSETTAGASRFERYMVLGVSVFKEDYDHFLSTLQDVPHRRRPRDCAQVLVLVRHHQFFRNMPKKLALEVCRRMTLVNVASNTVIFQQGSSGDCFYLINTGSTEVHIRDNSMDGIRFRLYPGDIFGEGSVADNEPREGTVVAKEDLTLIRIDQETFDTMSGYFGKENENLVAFVRTRLARPFFQDLREEKLTEMLQQMSAVTFKRGETIVTQGVIPTHPCLYIVKRGRCRGFKTINAVTGGLVRTGPKSRKKVPGVNICYYNIGDVFGSFTSDILVCPYNVVAMSEVTLFKLNSSDCSLFLPKHVLDSMSRYVQAYNVRLADMVTKVEHHGEWSRYKSMVVESCDKQFQVKKTALSRVNPISSTEGRSMELPKAPVPDHHTPLPSHLLRWSSDKLLSKLSLNFNLIPAKVEGGRHDGIKRVNSMSHVFEAPEVVLDESEMDEEREQEYVQTLINKKPISITEKVTSRDPDVKDKPSKMLTSQEALRYSSARLPNALSLPAQVIEKANIQRRGIMTGISKDYLTNEMPASNKRLSGSSKRHRNRDSLTGNLRDSEFTEKTLGYITKHGAYQPLVLEDVPIRNRLLDRLADEVNEEADDDVQREKAKFEQDQARLAKLKEQLRKNVDTGDVLSATATLEADEYDAIVLKRMQSKQLLDLPEVKKSAMDFSDEYYDDLVRRRDKHKATMRADRMTMLPPSVSSTSLLRKRFTPVFRLAAESGGDKRGLPDLHHQALHVSQEDKERVRKQRRMRKAMSVPAFVTHVSASGYSIRNPFFKNIHGAMDELASNFDAILK